MYRSLSYSIFLAPLLFLTLPSCADHDDDLESGDDVCSGLANGTVCGDATDTTCNPADTCQAGHCVSTRAPTGTPCGDATATECDAPDSCDGAGACLPNKVADGTACGDSTDTACNPADTCLAGTCQTILAQAGAACGDAADSTCDAADTCDGAGKCLVNLAADGTTCGDLTDTTCNPADTCLSGECQTIIAEAGAACGDDSSTTCNAPDTCDGVGACQANYAILGTPCGDTTIDTMCNAADTCDGSGACGDNIAPDGLACYDCTSGPGSCGVCGTSTCADRNGVCDRASTTLASTFAGGNNHRGNMFDLTAINALTILSFDVSPMSSTTIEIYYRPGSYAGFESTSTGWTLIGSGAVAWTGAPVPVPVAINVNIPAGATYAFYVTSTTQAVSLNYTDGGSEGAVYASDASLQLRQGVGMEYPFTRGTGTVYRPRVWNGVIHYDTLSSLNNTTEPYADGVARGTMFDVQALAKTELHSIEVELAAGVQNATAYFRRGTHVGHEASADGWESIGAINEVNSAGGGARTALVFVDPIELDAAETIGVYIDADVADQLRINAGGAVGDVAATNGVLSLQVGTTLGEAFGGIGTAAAVRALIDVPACVTAP